MKQNFYSPFSLKAGQIQSEPEHKLVWTELDLHLLDWNYIHSLNLEVTCRLLRCHPITVQAAKTHFSAKCEGERDNVVPVVTLNRGTSVWEPALPVTGSDVCRALLSAVFHLRAVQEAADSHPSVSWLGECGAPEHTLTLKQTHSRTTRRFTPSSKRSHLLTHCQNAGGGQARQVRFNQTPPLTCQHLTAF